MKYKDSTTGNFKELFVKATDELPIGSEITVADDMQVPLGWEEIDDPYVYSTLEKRIGTWTDGKPIYRKVLNFTTGAQYDNMSKTLINFSNVKMVLKYYGQIQCSDVPRALPHKQSSILIIDATQIRFDIDGDTSGVSGGRTCHLVLEYTKTTD